jgi:hypothetical protein
MYQSQKETIKQLQHDPSKHMTTKTAPAPVHDPDKEHRIVLRRLKADLKTAAATLKPAEARYLVDLYYQVQEFRKASKNQVRAGENEPNALLAFMGSEFNGLETLVKNSMDAFTNQFEVTRWAKSLIGVGPVLTAGIYSQIDISKAPTTGSIWRFAGLDPTVRWFSSKEAPVFVKAQRGTRKLTPDVAREIALAAGKNPDAILRFATTNAKGEPRNLTATTLASALAKKPWNGRLKTLLWKFADCQVKFHNHKDSFYGPLYANYKAKLVLRNNNGEFAEAAKVSLARLKSKTTDTYKANLKGRLSNGHLDMRAKRWVAKLFVSHWHSVAHREHYGKPAPKPYVIAHMDHVHMIEVPNDPFKSEAA